MNCQHTQAFRYHENGALYCPTCENHVEYTVLDSEIVLKKLNSWTIEEKEYIKTYYWQTADVVAYYMNEKYGNDRTIAAIKIMQWRLLGYIPKIDNNE